MAPGLATTPVHRRSRLLSRTHLHALVSKLFLKPMGSLVGIISSYESTKCKVSKPPIHEMFGCQAGHLPVIGINQGQAKTANRTAQIHRRHAEPTDKRAHFLRFHPGNESVPVPITEPFWKSVGPLPFLALHGPFVVFAHELGNSQK